MDNALQEVLCQQLTVTGVKEISQVFLKFAIVPHFLFLSFLNGPMIQCGSQVIQYSTAQTPIAFNSKKNKEGDNDYERTVKIVRSKRY